MRLDKFCVSVPFWLSHILAYLFHLCLQTKPHFHVPFWLSYALVFYLICPSLKYISKINKQGYGLAIKEHGNTVKDSKVDYYNILK